MDGGELEETLAFAMQVQELRSVYHHAMGEKIQLRLAYPATPDITVTEDLPTDTVTMRLRDDPLALRPGGTHAERQAVTRAWIRERVDVTQLKMGAHRGPGVAYWRHVGRGLI